MPFKQGLIGSRKGSMSWRVDESWREPTTKIVELTALLLAAKRMLLVGEQWH
jgi:hypothetical protein